MVNYTKQSINRSNKPTKIYNFNEDSTKRYKEIIYVGRGLFICRINKLITDSDIKVYLALKYLKDTRQSVTQLDIERVSGVARTKINTSLKNLEYRDIININEKNIENLKNIKFDMLIINQDISSYFSNFDRINFLNSVS